MKKHKLLYYHTLHDIIYLALLLLFVICFSFACKFLALENDTFTIIDLFLIITVILNGSTTQSLQNYPRYLTFQFSRRKFFREQVILSLLRSMFLSLFRTLWLELFYENYVEFFLSDTDNTPAMFHAVPFVELFLTNMVIFLLLYLILLVNSTNTIAITFTRYEHSPQLQLRIQNQKEQHKISRNVCTVIVKTLSFVGVVALTIGLSVCYEYQLQSTLINRLPIMIVPFVLCILFYFIGRTRFSPKYI